MAEGEWSIQEVRMAGSSLILRVPAFGTITPRAGQYFQVFAPGSEEPAATSLFLAGENISTWDLTGTISPRWNPGGRLRWRGPLGHGFNLPGKVDKAAFIPWHDSGLMMLPLLQLALKQGAAVVWFSREVPDWLPPQVEVLPPEAVSDVFSWAEYIALTCDMQHYSELVSVLGVSRMDHLPCKAEVLLRTALVCGGIGDCGVCAVNTHLGWKLACKDGPVFDLNQVEV